MGWIENESARIESEKQKSREEKGLVPFWKPKEGVQEVEIMADKEPEQSKSYPEKKEMHVMTDGKEQIWTVNPKSPLYADIIKGLKAGARKFQIFRMGTTAKDTRYKVTPIAP